MKLTSAGFMQIKGHKTALKSFYLNVYPLSSYIFLNNLMISVLFVAIKPASLLLSSRMRLRLREGDAADLRGPTKSFSL